MGDLVATYGYASSGESFSILDPNEVWILEMIGKGPGQKVRDCKRPPFASLTAGVLPRMALNRVPSGWHAASPRATSAPTPTRPAFRSAKSAPPPSLPSLFFLVFSLQLFLEAQGPNCAM